MKRTRRDQRHQHGQNYHVWPLYKFFLAPAFRPKLSMSLNAIIGIILLCGVTAAQSSSPKNEELDNQEEVELKVRSRYILEDLRREALSLPEEKNRAYALAEVADAYWNLDQDRAVSLFTAAMDICLTLKPGNTASRAIRHVLFLASKRGVTVAKRLSNQLTNHRRNTERSTSESVETAIDLLKSDPKTAVELAEAVAPAGLSDDAVGVFILELAQKDLGAAERVYRTYLSRSAADPALSINQLLWLGGYPFGYGETYSFANNDPARLVGLGGRQIPGLLPNPQLANAFLNTAFRRIQKTISEAAPATAPTKEAVNGICYFATLYLIPEVERYNPSTAGSWWTLRQQAFAAISPPYRESMEKQFELVTRNRATIPKNPSQMSSDESDLREAENIPAGCERDRAYAKASLSNHSKNENGLALRVAEKIDDVSLRESVLQFIYFDVSIASAKEGEWIQALRNATLIVAPQQRGLLYINLAHLALRQNDVIRAAEVLTEADRFADKISDPSTKATVLLACAAAFAAFDSIRSIEVLRRAVKATNAAKDQNVENFRVLRKVDFNCSGNQGTTWYGNSETVEQFSLLETLATIAKVDAEGTLETARSIENPTIRIRSIASVIRTLIASKDIRAKLKLSPPV